MSLKDTIRGAREEAAASGNPFERKSQTADASGCELDFSRENVISRSSFSEMPKG